MKNLLAILILACLSISSNASEAFKPFIQEGNNLPVCQLALKHYQNIYESSDNTTTGIKSSREVYIPELSPADMQDTQGTLETTTIEIEGQQKTIAFFSRELGWRGLIYSGYMISAGDLENLKKQIKESDEGGEIKHFYPMGDLAYGSNFSWWLNMPFQYQSNWYVLGDFRDFSRHNAIRYVYKLRADSSSEKICAIQIYKNYEPKKSNEGLPYFAAYINSLETMLVSPGSCGTSHPEAFAKSNGQLFASSALIRPWAISNPTKGQTSNSLALEKQLQNHFDHWKYTDIWTYRENESFAYLMVDAERELTQHYVSNLGYDLKSAADLAKRVIYQAPLSYYSLGNYIDSNKDFSAFQKMAEGKFQGWVNIDEVMSLHYGKVQDVAYTLMLDNPEQYLGAPESIKLDKIETEFKKNLLMYAAHMNNYDAVEWLIKSGFPTNKVTVFKTDMCAQFPERTNRSALTYAVENGSIALIQLLIDAGEKLDIIDTKGNNLDFYLNLNPRFTAEEKKLGLKKLIEKYRSAEIKPSFSCSATLGKIEKAICNSKGLSIYDDELGKAYAAAIAADAKIKESLKQSQREWLRKRTNDCMSSQTDQELNGCIARTTRSRIHYLGYLKSNLKVTP